MPIVKKEKLYVPTLAGEMVPYERVTKVSSLGQFSLSFPEYLYGVARAVWKDQADASVRLLQDCLAGENFEKLDKFWNITVRNCKDYVIDQVKEKVLVVTTELVSSELHIRDSSFSRADVLIGMTYSTAWRVGGRVIDDIYREVAGTSDRDRKFGRGGTHVIPWTQERENFLAGMNDCLERAVRRIVEFERVVEEDPAAIDQWLAGAPLLLGPETKEDDHGTDTAASGADQGAV